AALLLFSPFVPLLFQGEEWAASSPFPYVADFDAADLVRAVRDGRQREFAEAGWSAGAPDPFDDVTFASARLDWSELVAEPHRRALDWYRSLLSLRRQWPELSDGRL